MLNPSTPEAHALVILGEVRGDVKGILRSQTEFTHRLAELELRVMQSLEEVETETGNRLTGLHAKLKAVEDRLSKLESIRLKAIGAFAALAALSTLWGDDISTLIGRILK